MKPVNINTSTPGPEQGAGNNGHNGGGQDYVQTELPPKAYMRDYLRVLLRRRWLILLLTLAGTGLVAVYVMIMPQTFSASATLLPPDKAESVSFSSLIQKSVGFDLGSLGSNSSAELFITILKSRVLADSLIARFDLLDRFGLDTSQKHIAQLVIQSSFEVFADRQGVMTINYNVRTGYLPSRQEQREAAVFSAKMVNGAIEVLDLLNRRKMTSSARRSREFIGRMRTIKRAELDSAQREFQRFQQTNRAVALDKQIDASVTALAAVQGQIQQRELALSSALNELSPDNRQVEGIRSQIEKLKSQKMALEGGQAGGETFALNMRNVPDLSRQFANLKLNLEVATQVYTFLEAQYNQEQVQEARDLPTVNVLDYAEPPAIRSLPRRGTALMIAFPLFLLLSVVLAFVVEALARQRATTAGADDTAAAATSRRWRSTVSTS